MIKEKPAILNLEQGVEGHTPVATFIVLAILKDACRRPMSYDQIVKAAMVDATCHYVCDETLEVRYGKHRLSGVSPSEYVKFIHNFQDELLLALQQLEDEGLSARIQMQ